MRVGVEFNQAWVSGVAGRLIDGEKLIMRTLPRMGKTHMCRQIVELLGETAFWVSGRDFASADSNSTPSEIVNQVTQRVEEFGSAQLIFDDFGHALSVPDGQRLQAALHGTLVNSSLAESIGAFATARWGDRLHVAKAGSPLLSRLTPVSSPAWTPEDLPQGMSSNAVVDTIGHGAGALVHALGERGDFDHRRLTAVLDLYADQICRSLLPKTLEYVAGRCDLNALSPVEIEPIHDLIGNGYMVRAARESTLRTTASGLSKGWPTGLVECVQAFATLLDGQARALWVDRYVFGDIPRLRQFLILVRKRTSVRLRILGSDRPKEPVDLPMLKSLHQEVAGVEFRTMTPVQYRLCHDRHLAFDDNSGYAIPIAQVILGHGEPGTAVAAHSPSFPRDYSRIWSGANSVS